MPRPQDTDRAAFHRHIAEINGRRIAVLTAVTTLLCAISFAANLAAGGIRGFSLVTGPGLNVTGIVLSGIVYATYRWLRLPGLSAILYGCLVLAWGDLMIPTYIHEIEIGHAAHAAQNLVIYFITRYLAAVAVVWRPRDLAIVLLLNHGVSLWPLVASQGLVNSYLYTGLWTATAWLGAYMIYRAERDAFIARLRLQEQRDALASANTNLERLNQEKNDLMAIAAHDLRSPLVGMTTLLNLAAEDAAKVWAAGVGTLRALEQSGRDMADLVTRVLEVHQAEDTVDKVALVNEDLRSVVTRAIEAHRVRADAKEIALTVETPAEPCLAIHDPLALRRVLDNLGSNAIKFTPRGGHVWVRVTDAGDGVSIAVTDSGPGISEDDRKLMFRKFARLRARPTEGESSSGLGLYIVKRLVDAMRGSIAVSGAPGEGATFTIRLSSGTAAQSIG